MLNPNYDRYAELLAQLSDLLPDHAEAKQESKAQRFVRRLRVMALIASLTTLTMSCVSHLSNIDCIDAEEVDVVEMVPQAGILSTIGSAVVPGLIGGAVSFGKKVTGDLLDKVGSTLKRWTGLHNPNEAVINQRIIQSDVNFSNVVDTKQFFEKLDPHANSNRIVSEPIFGTTIDEMDVSNITAKDQFLGTFQVSSTDVMGKRLWNKPISPFQGGLGTLPAGIMCVNNLELLHSIHRGWRGGLKLKIQSVMNNKQQVKLKVIKYYNPSPASLISYPDYLSVVNAPSHLLEFTQGGQMLEVNLPYLCRNAITPRGENPDMEPMMHGIYYIYLAQPLVTSDGSPAVAEFNVYMCGDEDLQFYGYVTSNTYHGSFYYEPPTQQVSIPEEFTTLGLADMFHYNPPDAAAARRTAKVVSDLTSRYGLDQKYFNDARNIIVKGGVVVAIRSTPNMPKVTGPTATGEEPYNFDNVLEYANESFSAQSAPLTVMNEPQEQHTDLKSQRETEPVEITRLMPTVNMRDIVRRMYKSEVTRLEVSPEDSVVRVYPLAKYVSELPNDWAYTPVSLISRMYYGKTVGFKIRITVTLGTSEAEMPARESLGVRIFYQPQGVNINTSTFTISRAGVNAGAYGSTLSNSFYGEPPFTYQVSPVKQYNDTLVYEFVVPDTSYYKFLGSPEKFRGFSSSITSEPLSTNDFGSLILIFTNHAQQHTFQAYAETFIGLTDESRLGFQTIAPPFQLSKSFAFYNGNNDDPIGPIPDTLNPYTYSGGLIT
jgi:hypothetical protein